MAYEIGNVFQIINQVYDNTIGFVCNPTYIVYLASWLGEKVQTILKKAPEFQE